jgi:hypothetical protein
MLTKEKEKERVLSLWGVVRIGGITSKQKFGLSSENPAFVHNVLSCYLQRIMEMVAKFVRALMNKGKLWLSSNEDVTKCCMKSEL